MATGAGVGDGVGVDDGLGVKAAPTWTLCSTLAPCPSASVTVKRTYFVPAPWKVNVILGPLPSSEPSASSVQPYEHGVAAHVLALPSKATACPLTGINGE